MKKYTIEDFNSFKKDENGRIICQSGDYSEIKEFPNKCYFLDECNFGRGTCFKKECTFGYHNTFGAYCSFGKACSFDESCSFGANCVFYDGNYFGRFCYFGRGCRFFESCQFDNDNVFGAYCSFDNNCSFGKGCVFGEECDLDANNLQFENLKDEVVQVVKIDRIGSRKGCTYFFKTENNIYVRCGCFFGTIEEFEKQVKETHAENEQYLKEYLGAINYIKSIM